MDKYSVIITPYASAQINDIALYISKILLNPKAAYAFLKSLEERIKCLDLFPNAYSLVDEKPWDELGVRKIIIKSFVVYYIVKNDTKQVFIISVINSKRNQLKQLNMSISHDK